MSKTRNKRIKSNMKTVINRRIDMVKNVIFDIGSVLLHYDFDSISKSFSDNHSDWDFLNKEVVMSPEWTGASLIDYGYLTVEEAIAQIQDRTHHKKDELVRNFLLHCHEDRQVAKSVIKRIKQLKNRGYKIYLLSNAGEKMIQRFRKACNLFKLVDGYIFSYEVHQVKPSPSIYKSLIEKYQLDPQESVFIDDNSVNIKTALDLGLIAHKVETNSEKSVLDAIKDL